VLKALKKVWADGRGYGTVELLVLVAALGVVATTLMVALKGRVNTASNTVGDQIDTLLQNWTTAP
jgi:Flp pilus assembly pilin Flp